MKKFRVTYVDRRVYYAEVEARNEAEAVEKADALPSSELEQAWDNPSGLEVTEVEDVTEIETDMKLPEVEDVKSAAEARELAIDWQNWQSEQSLSLGELAEYQGYFEALAKKFPELKEELKENAII